MLLPNPDGGPIPPILAAGWGSDEWINLAVAIGTISLAVAALWTLLYQHRGRVPFLVQVRHDPSDPQPEKVFFIRGAAQGAGVTFDGDATHRGEIVLAYVMGPDTIHQAEPINPDGPFVGLSLPIQNIGPGLAVIRDVVVVDAPWRDDVKEAWADDTALATNATTRLNVLISTDFSYGWRYLRFVCEVRYRDVLRWQNISTRFHVEGLGGAPLLVVKRCVRRGRLGRWVCTHESRIGFTR